MNKKKLIYAAILLWATILTANAQSWSLTGNAGTNANNNFIGTRDSRALIFKTNNQTRMSIASYGGLRLIDPGVNASGNQHNLLYGEKSSTGIGIFIKNIATNNVSAAILGMTSGPGAGILGQASQSGATGVYGYGDGSAHGVKAYAYNAAAVNASSQYGFGLYAATGYATYAAYFNRSIFVNGGYYSSSDQKLKQNIKDVTSALEIIHQLHPKKYHYRQDANYKLLNLPSEEQYGLLAQEVEKVLPGLVKDTRFDTSLETRPQKPDTQGIIIQPQNLTNKIIEFKALNYTGLIPIMIKGIQEQQALIQTQQEKINIQDKKIEKLLALIDQLSGTSSLPGNASVSNSKDESNQASLTQNAPNPFDHATTIHYYVPQQAGSAVITVSDQNGKLIKSHDVSAKGNGQLVIEGGQLAPGTYFYTLMVEGKRIDTKKMVLLR